jgi:hypothetical protein
LRLQSLVESTQCPLRVFLQHVIVSIAHNEFFDRRANAYRVRISGIAESEQRIPTQIPRISTRDVPATEIREKFTVLGLEHPQQINPG